MNLPSPWAKVGQAPKIQRPQSSLQWRLLWGLWAYTRAERPVLLTALLIILLSISLGCGKKKVEMASLGLNVDSSYMMRTEGIDMLISDSGITKYRLVSSLWLIYDNKDRQEWYFPKGLKLEGYDTLQPSEVLILADTARYLPLNEEWQLWGNVRIHGPKGERLYTPRLYWLKGGRRLYSNDTTYFLTEGRELHGDRFDAKDDLSSYSIYNNRGSVEYEERDMSASAAPPAP